MFPSSSGTPFYSTDGGITWNEITDQCQNADGEGIIFPKECYYRTGVNMLVWTYHFSKFAVGEYPTPPSPIKRITNSIQTIH